MAKTKFILLLTAVLLAGVCLGFYADRLIIHSRIRHFSRVPADLPRHITSKLTHELTLTEQQQTDILAILQVHNEKMQAAHESTRTLFTELSQAMRQEVSSQLTPEQQERYRLVLERLDERRKNNRQMRRAVGAPPPPPPATAAK